VARQIKWTPRAIDDLAALGEFISRDSPHFANLTIRNIVNRFEQAAAFPLSGRVVPERNQPNLRELFWKDYRLIYRVWEDHIEVVAIWHGRRLLKDLP
jgi:addiction module RelE/StbE family toxin